MRDRIKIHIIGMGGQGIGATSRILGAAARNAGLPVITMETHGLAQRGGVVVSDLAVGYVPSESPLCAEGEADVVIALEALESLRALPKLTRDGIVIVNTVQYQPLTVRISKGETKYPSLEEIKEELTKWTPNVVLVDAHKDATELGLSQAMNVILIGALQSCCEVLPFSEEDLRNAVLANVPPKYHDLNLKAFEKGLEYHIVA